MTDENQAADQEQETAAEETKAPAARGRKAKDVTVRNSAARPITLIANSGPNGRVTILPTEIAQIEGEMWKQLEENKAAMTFFDSGELVKV